MKRILLAILLCINFLYSQDFVDKFGYEKDYKVAIKKAKEHKKDIVMVIVSDYCSWCDRLKEEVLSLEYTDEILKKHYIPLMVNSSSDNYPSKFDSYVVPAVHFVSFKDESIIETVLGFNNNYRFYEIIEAKK